MSPRDFLFFFGGCDPAPSEARTSADGAFVAGAATPRSLPDREETMSTNPADWHFDFVYARRFTSKEKLRSVQWSGYLHTQHQRFRFEKLVLDPGAGGGGVLIKRDLIQPRQLINGIEMDARPIGDVEDGPRLVARGDFILHLMKRGDPGVEKVWPNPVTGKSVSGDELLKDAVISSFQDAVDHGVVAWPAAIEDWFVERKLEVTAWPEERLWALKVLNAGPEQLKGASVLTGEDGIEVRTARGARQFKWMGKSDIGLAHIYCYAAFLIWLHSERWRRRVAPEDECAFSATDVVVARR